MQEKKVLIQGAVSLVALVALVFFVEWVTVATEFPWLPLLYEFPLETVIVLALLGAFLGWLIRAVKRWLIGPFVRWVGKGT